MGVSGCEVWVCAGDNVRSVVHCMHLGSFSFRCGPVLREPGDCDNYNFAEVALGCCCWQQLISTA